MEGRCHRMLTENCFVEKTFDLNYDQLIANRLHHKLLFERPQVKVDNRVQRVEVGKLQLYP